MVTPARHKKKPKKSPGQSQNDRADKAQLPQLGDNAGGVYIGVPAGSDMERIGTTYKINPSFAHLIPVRHAAPGPRYKVGYQNSSDFRDQLGGMNPNVIYFYQQQMHDAGLLDKYTPGQLDTPTRAAFKGLMGTANQTGATWQSVLYDGLSANGGSGVLAGGSSGSQGQQPDAFVATPDDPATLREAFQHAAQTIYGGDLPDDEVNAMVDAFRGIQTSKQLALHNANNAAANGVSGSVDAELSSDDFAREQIKAHHPQQVNRVKFQDSLSTMMNTFSSQAPGQ